MPTLTHYRRPSQHLPAAAQGSLDSSPQPVPTACHQQGLDPSLDQWGTNPTARHERPHPFTRGSPPHSPPDLDRDPTARHGLVPAPLPPTQGAAERPWPRPLTAREAAGPRSTLHTGDTPPAPLPTNGRLLICIPRSARWVAPAPHRELKAAS